MSKLKSVVIDVKRDLFDEVKGILDEHGFQTPSFQELGVQDPRDAQLISKIQNYDLDILLTHFFTMIKRIIPAQKRKVEISKEFSWPSNSVAIHDIKDLFTKGEKVSHLQSKKVSRLNQWTSNDLLLYEWNIHHLHLSPEGTNELLFVYLTADSAYFLTVLPHESPDIGNETWTNPELIQIIHNNWPSIVQRYKYRNAKPESSLTAEERRTLRRKHCNKFLTVSDGTTYMPFGGGFMASGHPRDAVFHAHALTEKIERLQKIVEESADEIKQSLPLMPDQKMDLRIRLDEDFEPHLVEENLQAVLNFEEK